MGKKILDSKLLYAALAIVIAIGLWFYVATVENRDSSMEITGVPITFLNEDVLYENGLMIAEGRNQTATLTVVGPRTTLARLDREKETISLTIDVGRITTPGQQRMAYTLTLPAAYRNSVQVTNRNPNNVDFTVSRWVSQEKPVHSQFTGTLAEGYLRDEITVRPESIEITGIESQVSMVDHVLVTVPGEELSSTFIDELPFVLIGKDGEELTDLDVECSAEAVLVTMPVIRTADVPLTVALVYGGGVTSEKNVTVEITPKTITVSGADELLTPLREIILGEVNLADVTGVSRFTMDIPLDSALTNVSGVAQATVTVTVHGLTTKRLEASNIELTNVPEGFDAETVTKSLAVQVRGPAAELDLVYDYSLLVVADLSEVGTAPGRYTVPVRIILNSSSDNAGVLGSDYKIVVELVKRP